MSNDSKPDAQPPNIQSGSAADIQDWNNAANCYVQVSNPDEDRIYRQFKSTLWECLGDVRDMKVLDVGCGHGWFSHELHKAGAHVCGVDGSRALLAQARAACPDIPFLEHDLMQGLPPFEYRFERIVANMVLMDIPDIGPLLKAIRAVLKRNGKFVFTMPHPCFFQCKSHRDEETGRLFRKVKGYLTPEVWRIESFGGHNHYHRSLTYYCEHLRQSGMALTRLYEPEHIPLAHHSDEDLAYYKSIPVFILMEAMPHDFGSHP